MLYDSIYLKYKIESVVLEVRIMVTLGRGERHEEASGVLLVFYFLIWVL